ncbi:MAG: ABC transporter permease [Alphaproteobacteria bacterium]
MTESLTPPRNESIKAESGNSLKARHIGFINHVGLATLVKREVGRFLKVYSQTIIAPVVTTLLFFVVFALAFGGNERLFGEVPFLVFLAPGLIMMTMAQNAFANSSSSLIIGKVQGNIIDVLMPPLSSLEIFSGFLIGSVLRGLCVGAVAIAVIALFVPMPVHSAGVIIAFSVLGNVMMGTMGIMAGMWAEKFDHIAAFTNFFVTPLTFLSGTFYSIDILPEPWKTLAFFNPFFYMIDGFRHGFIGHAPDVAMIGIYVLLAVNVVLIGLTYALIQSGYKIKH